jgi:hypothetical protein
MRARVLFAAGLVAVVVGACSDPPADTGVAIDPNLEANLDLALNSEPAVEASPVPVASPLEAPRPPEAKPEPQRARRRPAAVSPQPRRQTEAPVVAHAEPEPQLAQAPEEQEEPRFTLSPWPRTTDVVPEGATTAREGRGEAENSGSADDGAVDGRSSGRGRGPVILIRGGVGERDPCAIHMPGRGRGGIAIGIGGIIFGGGGRGSLGPAGVLINERVRRVGPDQNRVLPATGGDVRFPGSGPLLRRGGLR